MNHLHSWQPLILALGATHTNRANQPFSLNCLNELIKGNLAVVDIAVVVDIADAVNIAGVVIVVVVVVIVIVVIIVVVVVIVIVVIVVVVVGTLFSAFDFVSSKTFKSNRSPVLFGNKLCREKISRLMKQKRRRNGKSGHLPKNTR